MHSALSIVHPLHSLPSILAIADLQPPATGGGPLDDAQIHARLAADPLALFRAIRLTCTPIQAAPIPANCSLEDLVQRLGTQVGTGLFDVGVVGTERTKGVRRVWLRGLAAAVAAELAAGGPESATGQAKFLAALVTPKERWLEALAKHHNGGLPDLSVADWSRRWHLAAVPTLPDFDRFDRAAEAAGFSLDDTPDPQPGPVTDGVRARLTAVGLDLDASLAPGPSKLRFGSFGDDDGDLTDVTALARSLSTCRSEPTVRRALSMALRSAVTHLDFDRAFVIHRSKSSGRCFVQTRADQSTLPFHGIEVRPSELESQLLDRACRDGRVEMLVRDGNEGLCADLGTDRALVTVFRASEGETHFAVLDRAIRCRDLDYHRDGPQVEALASLLSLLVDNLELGLHRKRAERNSRTDALTGLLNRRAGMRRLEEEIARSKRHATPLSAMMLDLDEFKLLNDRLGHQVGDRAIRLTAGVLRRSCRAEDVVCRIGGEEFLILLSDTDASDAAVIGTRLFVEIEDAGRAADLPLTASIGLAEWRASDSAEELVRRADLALFASKARGRNRLSVEG